MGIDKAGAAGDHDDHRPGADGRLLDDAAALAGGEGQQLAPMLVAQPGDEHLLSRDHDGCTAGEDLVDGCDKCVPVSVREGQRGP
ncbi:hypothetical protein ABZT34_07210 [Streptomyces sp. NPDC005329]|uniref:hypothetical protein n=1 Tax=Streptomyces sp. NPDC005329 TaxID=3157034 RepID=UPI0033A5427C